MPLFLLIKRCSIKLSALWGALYGFCKFFSIMFWMFSYNKPALVGVGFLMVVETVPVFLLCALVQKRLPRWSWLLMPLIMLLFEFLRTMGDLGFSYGIIGYSQWKVLPLVRSARIFGVWGVSFAIMLCGSVAANVIGAVDFSSRPVGTIERRQILFVFGCVAVLLAGGFVPLLSKATAEKTLDVVLIQPNSDPWKEGVEAYWDELQSLIAITDRALDEHPEAQLVVWGETAFVPDVVRHYTQKKDAARYMLSRHLLNYIEEKKRAFVLGNNHQETVENNGREEVQNYNSALFFEPGKNVFPPRPVVYNKMRLVPFTEMIPYPRLLTAFAKIFSLDTHFWSAGEKVTLFELEGIRFCTPICFEDTFSSGIRDMCMTGAELIVNLSNDSWAHSLASQNQHLSMAVFRCAENHVPAVRCTASGQTCFIDAQGRVTAELKPFTEGYLFGRISVGK